MDLEESLGEEMVQFQPLIALFLEEKEESRSIERFMYEVIIGKNLKSTFPNVKIVLRIYLCLMVSNCSGERSFSKLKLIKNNLRTTMNQDRLNWLSPMSIESDILRTLTLMTSLTTSQVAKRDKFCCDIYS